jgi:hypothetical protein
MVIDGELVFPSINHPIAFDLHLSNNTVQVHIDYVWGVRNILPFEVAIEIVGYISVLVN